MNRPEPVTPLATPATELSDRLTGGKVGVDEVTLDRLRTTGAAVSTDPDDRAAAGRDWWPLSILWVEHGQVASRPAVVVTPRSTDEVSAVMAICHEAGIPVTPFGGRSGVCGASVPLYGGVALDLTGLDGLVELDEESLIATFKAGTYGPDVEAILGASGLTLGHWPQSMALSTVGGWLACRGAGQYSNRYGKIEDMVIGLEAVLADGTVVTTGGAGPRSATGSDLTQLLVGSEGTLAVITEATFRVHPRPAGDQRRAFGFASFADGLEACRRILRRGATPAVLRLYDTTESVRSFGVDTNVLIVLDEADPVLLAATMVVVDEECGGSDPLDVALVERWLGHRNDVSSLGPLWQGGVVVDTVEISARWSALPGLYDAVCSALLAQEGTLVASSHQSLAYTDGACLYFTFAGRHPGMERDQPPPDDLVEWNEQYYRAAWDAVTEATQAAGGAISHHHGIGLNRARFLPGAMGPAFAILEAVKHALDPKDLLNPGKLGLPTDRGGVNWP